MEASDNEAKKPDVFEMGGVANEEDSFFTSRCGISPWLRLSLTCPVPESGSFKVGQVITVLLTLFNDGPQAFGVKILDKVYVPANVSVGNLEASPHATINPILPTYENTIFTVTWLFDTLLAESSTQLKISFTVLTAPPEGANIEQRDAGICKLSLTDEFSCDIPVTDRPPSRGMDVLKLSQSLKTIIY